LGKILREKIMLNRKIINKWKINITLPYKMKWSAMDGGKASKLLPSLHFPL
jgi:hypothetical protein